MITPSRFLCLALAFLLVEIQTAPAQQKQKRPAIAFGTLEALSPDAARNQAADWLKSVGKTDAASLQRFDSIWKQEDRPMIERLADTFALGNADAAKLLSAVRTTVPMVGEVPAILKDGAMGGGAMEGGKTLFFRANLALAYARNLSNRRAYEEALDVLKLFQPEEVADPATYLFHRAVCEHGLLNKAGANQAIARLLGDCADAPERYRNVGLLMFVDMTTWKEKDLGAVSRLMENVEGELERYKGGPKTQKKQRQIVARLDELIKELENKQKKDNDPSPNPNGDGCPNGKPEDVPMDGPPGNDPSRPMETSRLPGGHGIGEVERAKLARDPQKFIQLPPAEQQRVLQDILKEIDPRYREAVERYYEKLIDLSRKSR